MPLRGLILRVTFHRFPSSCSWRLCVRNVLDKKGKQGKLLHVTQNSSEQHGKWTSSIEKVLAVIVFLCLMGWSWRWEGSWSREELPAASFLPLISLEELTEINRHYSFPEQIIERIWNVCLCLCVIWCCNSHFFVLTPCSSHQLLCVLPYFMLYILL